MDNGTVAWITGAAAVGGGLVGGLVSGFYQHVRDRMQRPILKLDYQGMDGLNKVEVSYKQGESSVDDIYIRVRLRNEGRSIARKSVVYLTAIEEVYTSAQTPTCFAEAMPLAWPKYKFGPLDIPTGPDFYVDLVRISKHDSGWNFSVEQLLTSHVGLKTFKGTYRLHLMATADNAESAKFALDIAYSQDWHGLRAHNVASKEEPMTNA